MLKKYALFVCRNQCSIRQRLAPLFNVLLENDLALRGSRMSRLSPGFQGRDMTSNWQVTELTVICERINDGSHVRVLRAQCRLLL